MKANARSKEKRDAAQPRKKKQGECEKRDRALPKFGGEKIKKTRSVDLYAGRRQLKRQGRMGASRGVCVVVPRKVRARRLGGNELCTGANIERMPAQKRKETRAALPDAEEPWRKGPEKGYTAVYVDIYAIYIG